MTKRSLMQSLGPHQSEEGVKKRLRKDQSKMKYKLVISKPISATDGLEEDGKAVFYKDQGGKLRTMEYCSATIRRGKYAIFGDVYAFEVNALLRERSCSKARLPFLRGSSVYEDQ